MEPREEFEMYSRQRLYPPITNPSWLVLRGRRRIFAEWLKDAPIGMNVLDIGGALQPYRPMLPQDGLRYTAVDVRKSPLVDKIATAEELPFADDTFDLVICTQVLEFIQRPQIAMDEIRRVLKPGGRALITVPAIEFATQLADKWRYTPAMLRTMTSSFSKAEITHEVGGIATAMRTVNIAVGRYAPIPRLWNYTLYPVLNAIGWLFEPTQTAWFSANYAVMATK